MTDASAEIIQFPDSNRERKQGTLLEDGADFGLHLSKLPQNGAVRPAIASLEEVRVRKEIETMLTPPAPLEIAQIIGPQMTWMRAAELGKVA